MMFAASSNWVFCNGNMVNTESMTVYSQAYMAAISSY